MYSKGVTSMLECLESLLQDLPDAIAKLGIPWYVWLSWLATGAFGWYLAGLR